jgi:hypothetical protein
MPPLLTAASVLMCPHGGMVTASPASAKTQAGGPIVRSTDNFLVTGCAFNISGVPHPCVSIQWVQTATRVQVGGVFALTQSSVGLCVAADQTPQGPVQIQSTQPNVSGL